MAIVLGTNAGFVTVAPTTDPSGDTTFTIDSRSSVVKDTSPAGATKIVEVGWWCNEATEEANFEVGLYAADGAVVPGEAGTRLFRDATNAKGTTGGVWKSVVVDWDISESTDYWIGVQCDDTATTTTLDSQFAGGVGWDNRSVQTQLTDPFGGGALIDADGMCSIYAVWEAAPATATGNMLLVF